MKGNRSMKSGKGQRSSMTKSATNKNSFAFVVILPISTFCCCLFVSPIAVEKNISYFLSSPHDDAYHFRAQFLILCGCCHAFNVIFSARMHIHVWMQQNVKWVLFVAQYFLAMLFFFVFALIFWIAWHWGGFKYMRVHMIRDGCCICFSANNL